MNVVAWRDQNVEVAGRERATLDEFEGAVSSRVDLLVLLTAVETDQPPGKVVVNWRRRAGRDDEGKERQGLILGAIEKPLADASPHPALRSGRLVLGRKPMRVAKQFCKPWPERFASLLRRECRGDRRTDVVDKRPHNRRAKDELVIHLRRQASRLPELLGEACCERLLNAR